MQKKYIERIPTANAELPEQIGRLNELAYNLWWAWNPDAINLYKSLNQNLWDQVSHNPIVMLQQVSKEKLKQALEQAGLRVETGVFRTHMEVELVNDGPVTILLDSRKGF